MSSSYRDLLLFTLFGLAEFFMLWALWNFHKASGERKSSRVPAGSRLSPVVSIQNGRFQDAALRQGATSAVPERAEKTTEFSPRWIANGNS
jgi:hypothetical protein